MPTSTPCGSTPLLKEQLSKVHLIFLLEPLKSRIVILQGSHLLLHPPSVLHHLPHTIVIQQSRDLPLLFSSGWLHRNPLPALFLLRYEDSAMRSPGIGCELLLNQFEAIEIGVALGWSLRPLGGWYLAHLAGLLLLHVGLRGERSLKKHVLLEELIVRFLGSCVIYIQVHSKRRR